MFHQTGQEPSLGSVAAEYGNQKISSVPVAVPVPSKSDSLDIAVEKELEALPLLQAKISSTTPDVKGKEEELQLEEIRNRKTKQGTDSVQSKKHFS